MNKIGSYLRRLKPFLMNKASLSTLPKTTGRIRGLLEPTQVGFV